ncbi:MAG: GAF domain-containing protein [Leptolyngbyaceae cyanobacterium bins.302]|nr:GAF domain-containing protein [Leptolyngbyaceae cyanobacterium bins.302]
MTSSDYSLSYQPGQDSLLHRITNRIRQSLELQEILDAAVVEVRSFLGIDRVKIYRFYPDGHGEVIAESIQAERLPSLLGLHFPADDIPVASRNAFIEVRQRVIVDVMAQQTRLDCLDDPITGAALAQEDTRYRSVEPCHVEYLKAMGVRSSLVIPILHQESLWGLLVAHHSEAHDFAQEELQTAQLIADQVSIAIAQAALLAEARNKAQHAATMNQVAVSLQGLSKIDLQTGLETTIAALQSAGGRLYRAATAHQEPLLYCQGEQPRLPAPFQASILEQHILWTEYFRADPRQPSIPKVYTLNDLYAEPRLRVLAPSFRGTAIRGLLVMPLEYRQEFLGYLTLFRDEVNTETIWAGQFDSDRRQIQPRNSFAAWTEERRGLPAAWSADEVSLALAIAAQFAIAIYEYDLYQQAQFENQQRQHVETMLRRQAEEDQLRVSILQRIRQSLHLNTILDTTVAEVRQFLHVDRVLIYHFEPSWSGRVVAESVSSNELSILGRVIYDPCFSEKEHYKLYQQGRITQITNIQNVKHLACYFDLLNGLRVQANLVVPILMSRWDETEFHASLDSPLEPTLWGLLIAHNCFAPRHWQPWEVNFLQQLAVQVAIAVNQAELYQQVRLLNVDLEQQVQARTAELQQALEYEALLKRITDKVRDSLDEHQILQTAVDELSSGLQVDCCDAALYDLENRVTTVCYEHFRSEMTPAIGLSAHMDSRIELYTLLLSGRYLQFCILPGATSTIRSIGHEHAIFACPLLDDQGVLGDIWLFKPNQETFTDMEIRLVQQIANQCAIALRQARLYEASQAQVKELARLNQLKDDFLNTVSHELRTPMSSIKLATQMLEVILRETGILELEDHKAAQYFQILNTESKREINLINDLLDLARLDAGSEPLSLTTINFSVWIPHIAESFMVRTSEQQQQMEIDIPADLPAATTDLSYLERILSELLHNACKYTPASGLIRLSCQLHTDDVFQIRVTNTGIEIPDAERDRVFDKFYRIPNNDPWKHGGTGLGLALVKKLTEYLDGAIHIETEPNQTSFVITLPSLIVESRV